jgi:hypothetical protein
VIAGESPFPNVALRLDARASAHPCPAPRIYHHAVRAPWMIAVVIGCAPAPKPAEVVVPVEHAAVVAPIDAAVSAAEGAPPWVFAYRTAQRSETWTLRFADGDAIIEVATAQGTTRYVGTAVEGESLVLALAASTATISLSCKRVTRPIGTACNDAKAPLVEVLDCYHPDFAAPMPFGAAPGIEYVEDSTCTGYRLNAAR